MAMMPDRATTQERMASAATTTAPRAQSPEAIVSNARWRELVERGLPLTRRIAFRILRKLPSSVDVNDLIGAGHEGLLKAATCYDPERYPNFEPYAEVRIRGAILDELRAQDRMTRRGRMKLRRLHTAQQELAQRLGRSPEETEVAEELGVSLTKYRGMSRLLVRSNALSYGGDTDPDTVAAPDTEDPSHTLTQKELQAKLSEAIDHLPERSRTALSLYYLGDRTQAEIGQLFGITESRVCQILNEAVARLRVHLGVPAPAQRTRRTANRRASAPIGREQHRLPACA